MLARSRIFPSVAHDEYWTRRMYDHVTAARDKGMSIGFFSGNAVRRELVTYDSTVIGKPLRTIARLKEFEDEDKLMGVSRTVRVTAIGL
jgi:hypothetical protein